MLKRTVLPIIVRPCALCYLRQCIRTTYNVQRTAYSVQRTAYSVQRTAYSVQRTTYNVQRTTYNVQRTTYNVQRTTYNVQRTTYNVQRLVSGDLCGVGFAGIAGRRHLNTGAMFVYEEEISASIASIVC